MSCSPLFHEKALSECRELDRTVHECLQARRAERLEIPHVRRPVGPSGTGSCCCPSSAGERLPFRALAREAYAPMSRRTASKSAYNTQPLPLYAKHIWRTMLPDPTRSLRPFLDGSMRMKRWCEVVGSLRSVGRTI